MQGFKARRAVKRSGYTHVAAKQPPKDLLYYNTPLQDTTKVVQRRTDPSKVPEFAGVESSRMTELATTWARQGKSGARAIFEPPEQTDPITHREFENMAPRDQSAIEGAAGVRTDRMTFLHTNWITHPHHKKKVTNTPQDNNIAQQEGGAPEAPSTGLRRFGHKTTSRVSLSHTSGVPKALSGEELQSMHKSKEVRVGGGEVVYNVAGFADMLPGATHAYLKSDLPPSAEHRRLNDVLFLPGGHHMRPRIKRAQHIHESEEMAEILGGAATARSRRPEQTPRQGAMTERGAPPRRVESRAVGISNRRQPDDAGSVSSQATTATWMLPMGLSV